jgi:hypothetical protein
MLTSTVTLHSHIRNQVHMRIRNYHESALVFSSCGEEIVPFFLKQAHAKGMTVNCSKDYIKNFPYIDPVGVEETKLTKAFHDYLTTYFT